MKIAGCFLSGRAAVLGAAVFLLAGCAGDPGREAPPPGNGSSFGAGYPPGSAAWSDAGRSAYRTAFMAGMQDQKEGYRYDDDRGAQVLDVEERGFYRQGYRRGYYHEANVRRQERREAAAGEEKTGE